MKKLTKIEFALSVDKADECNTFLTPRMQHGWEEIPQQDGTTVLFRLFIEEHPLAMELIEAIKVQFPDSALTHEEQEPEDWTLAWKDFFNPIMCGERFEILPPWLAENGHDSTMHIVIEPKMAFGTGHHPTTSLCLESIGDVSLSDNIAEGMRFLDLGTGSGILGIGLCKLGLHGIGLDTDPQAIACAQENLDTNKVSNAMKLAVGSIESLEKEQKFDVVVANILSGPLIEMAGEIVPHVQKGGVLILSGILNEQAPSVAAAYDRCGIGLPVVTSQGEWSVLVWDSVQN